MDVLKEIFKHLRTTISSLQSQPVAEGSERNCSHSLRTGTCRAATLGSIVSALGKLELQVIWGSDDEFGSMYPCSVNHLVNLIRSIKIAPTYYSHADHCNPLPKVIQAIEKLLASHVSPLTAEHIAYLETQRAKLGLLATDLNERQSTP